MAPREDLITSAISFLQDPSVASSPLDKRIAFLQSKNLTQEEIDISLARANDEPLTSITSEPPQNTSHYSPSPQQQQQAIYRRNAPSNHNYSPYPPNWQMQAPPPELPKRDWRDWFIMATVAGGASYGIYVLTQRYIKPLIAPPTPPQLEQDKAAIDEQFNRAFALLDVLSSDTTALKEAEEARTRRLDAALTEVESVIAELKTSNQKREDENRRLESDIRGLKEAIPRAIDSVKENSEKRLKELGRELGSLKLLMGNRFGASPTPTPTASMGISARPLQADSGAGRSGTESPARAEDGAAGGMSGSVHSPALGSGSAGYVPSSASITASRPVGTSSPFGAAATAGRATIPAWQMAATNASKPKPATSTPTASAGTGSSSSSVNVESGGGDQASAGAG